MSEKPFFFENVNNVEETQALINRLFDVTLPEAVFSDPVTQGEYTVITAREVAVGMGAGFGGGGGTEASQPESEEKSALPASGYGGGGGGGGTSMARPVAAISIGPNGVRVESIVDPTKIAIAFLTTFSAMWMMAARIRKLGRKRR